MVRLSSWADPVGERYSQIGWVLDHEADLYADFLTFYRIDLDETDPGARRFVELAQRVAAFGGVMAARVDAARAEEEQPEPAQAMPARSSSGREVELVQFQAEFPGLVSISRVAQERGEEER